MKKIPVQFPERICCFVADKMMNVVNDELFYLTSDLRSILKADNYDPNDMIMLEASPAAIKQIITDMGYEYEYLSRDINLELREILLSQLNKYLDPQDQNFIDISETDPELLLSIQSVVTHLQERDSQRLTWVNNKIQSGRQRLLA